MEVVIEVADGGKTTLYKINKREIVFGRDPNSCDIVLKDDGSSKQHFMLEFRQNKWWVVDLDSKNGTIINNMPIKRSQLYLDDIVQIGEAYIRFAASKMSVAITQKLRRPGKKYSMNKSITLTPEKAFKKENLVEDGTHHGLKELTGIYSDTPPSRGKKVLVKRKKN